MVSKSACEASASKTTVRRHLPVAAQCWERLHVDLARSGLTRYVRHPFPVGRELPQALVGLAVQQRHRLVLAKERHDPQIELRLGSGIRTDNCPGMRCVKHGKGNSPLKAGSRSPRGPALRTSIRQG